MPLVALILTTLFLVPTLANAELSLNQQPVAIELKDKNGGRLDGTPWSSQSILEKEKVQVLFYVDPDEKDTNLSFEDELKRKADNEGYEFDSIAVINMAATWKPNWIISSILKGKQKKFPDTLYLKDLKKVLVGKWNLKDDAYNIVIFNKTGQVIFLHSGVLTKEDQNKAFEMIRSNM